MAEFRYYMLRVRHDPEGAQADPAALGGVVEQLGSGEKTRFASAQELLGLLGIRMEAAPNMLQGPASRNDPEAHGLEEKDHGSS